jgi:ATP-dependent DNA helicase RecG
VSDARRARAAEADLALPLTSLTGVGPARATALARLGLGDVRALLMLVPRRLEQSGLRRTTREAATHAEGEVAVLGTLRGLRLFRAGWRRSVLSLDLVDEHGSLRALFFNQPWLFERLRALAAAGTRVELSGKIGSAKGVPALLAPRLREDPPAESEPRLLPVYPTTAGVGQELLRRLVAQALERHGARLGEPLPTGLLAELALPSLPAAVRALHQPESREGFAHARRRLAFERLLALQARLARVRARAAATHARPVVLDPAARAALLAGLPFTPTPGQARALGEILDDMALPRPMRRLLQGEVGAGKTLVALAACAAVARAGGQAALLAPTELLAEQHRLGLAPALERFGVRAVLLTGSQKAPARRAALAELAAGRARLALGTHALLGPGVVFERLDLVVIDEQQRFGVAQKQALLEKGADVHALLMTATPIPRTLALCYYGDLETSLLGERPPGRGPLETKLVDEAGRDELLAFAAERAAHGERVFWVCPRIVEPEEDSADAAVAERESRAQTASAERAYAALQQGPLAAHGLALLHGRLSSERRLEAIERFRSGAARVLVSTSMVEVGVDVPEATVMVIEGAERFGLAQLHQLRGRVGRSSRPSRCYLFTGAFSGARDTRLAFLERCTDGFELAEEDLRRRGMGDLSGLRQAGENFEGLEEVGSDLALVRAARSLVREDERLCAHYLGEASAAALV